MSNLYQILAQLCEDRGISAYRMCKGTGVQPSVMTDLKMGRRSSVSAETADRLAAYFGVTVGYLLGKEEKKAPAETGGRQISQEEVKLALFGGEEDVTDAMWDEALFAIALIKERHKRKKDADG